MMEQNKRTIATIIVIILIVGTSYLGYKYYKFQKQPISEKPTEQEESAKILLESLPLPTITDEKEFYKQSQELLKSLPPPIKQTETEMQKALESLPSPSIK